MVGAISGNSGYSYYSYGVSLRTPNNPRQDQQANKIQNERIGGTQASGRMVGAQKAAQTGVPVQPVTPAPSVNVEGARHIDMKLPTLQAADPTELANRMRVQYAEGVQSSDSAGQIQKLAGQLSAKATSGMESAAMAGKALETSEVVNNARMMEPAELSARMRIQYGEAGVQGLNEEQTTVNPAAQSVRRMEGISKDNALDMSRINQPVAEEKQNLQIQGQQEKNAQNVQNAQTGQKLQNAQNETVPAFAAA